MSSPAERYAAARRRTRHPTLSDFTAELGFSLDAFQVEACEAVEEGAGVLVCAPTGAGKTVVGEFAVHKALSEGRKAFYTTPIKALSNQKYTDLVARYGPAKVGLLTGDNAINGDAPVVVMTTEVLRNMLYADSPALADLGYVVMDEVHYLADRFRGAVWEEVIIHLPDSVALVSLSATVSNAEEFGEWLVTVRGHTRVVVSEIRPVPLWQHMPASWRRPRAAGPPGSAARPSSTPSWSASSGSRSAATTPGPAGEVALAAASATSPATGPRPARRSSNGWTGPGCFRRSRSCSAATAATPPSTSAWPRGCG